MRNWKKDLSKTKHIRFYFCFFPYSFNFSLLTLVIMKLSYQVCMEPLFQSQLCQTSHVSLQENMSSPMGYKCKAASLLTTRIISISWKRSESVPNNTSSKIPLLFIYFITKGRSLCRKWKRQHIKVNNFTRYPSAKNKILWL